MTELVIVALPAVMLMAPPVDADRFLARLLETTVNSPLSEMPPPPPRAVLPLTVQFVSVAVV